MQQSIYGLSYDYIDQNGRYLMISSDDGLTNQELNSIQVKMLLSNSIPRLLPIEIEERDFAIKLRYAIGSRHTLKIFTRRHKLRADEFYQLLLNILNIIEDCKAYMLEEGKFILDENFIYIGKNISDICLVYLPLTEIGSNLSLKNELKKLIADLSDQTEGINTNDLQKLTSYINEQDHCNSSEIKKTLVSIISSNVPKSSPIQPADINRSTPEIKAGSHEAAPDADSLNQVLKAPAPTKPNTINRAKEQNASVDNNIENSPLSERARTFLFSGAALVIAFIWKIYLDNSSEGFLYLSIGLTFLVIDAVFIFIKVWRPGLTQKELNVQFPKKTDKKKKNKPATEMPQINEPASQPHTPVQPEDYYNNLSEKTTLLNSSDDTVILDAQDPDWPQEKPLVPVMKIERDGKSEIIVIKGDNFIIGRNPKTSNHVEDSSGVSRTHLEIMRVNDGWAVKDLDSKNGTYLNGERLIVNNVYPLQDGDLIKVATVEFTFAMEQV